MMKVEVVIIGQGIAGSTLALQLLNRGIEFVILDEGSTTGASAVSSGLINPITGRKFVKSWMIDELLPSSIEVYRQFEQLLKHKYINSRPIVRSIDTVEQENQWHVRQADLGYQEYINGDYTGPDYHPMLNDAKSFGQVHQSFNIQVDRLIKDFRAFLRQSDLIREEVVDYSNIVIGSDQILIGEISCKHLICAEGWGVKHNPFFRDLPFRPAKGEALIVKLDNSFPQTHILKYHKFFVPQEEEGLFWVGSNYFWDFDDEQPTENGRSELINYLNNYLKGNYEIVNHLAGVRPATKYRKPLIGQHGQYQNLWIFNGLGTKGISLAPYWSQRLIDHIMDNKALGSELPNLYS